MRTATGAHHAVHIMEHNMYWEVALGWLNLTALILGSSMVEMRNAAGSEGNRSFGRQIC
jgi:hypothetical protein